VIFDEAHNLGACAESTQSFELNQDQLTMCNIHLSGFEKQSDEIMNRRSTKRDVDRFRTAVTSMSDFLKRPHLSFSNEDRIVIPKVDGTILRE
jgi:Rad3-related DNA helicase